jgi:hypothetical protein
VSRLATLVLLAALVASGLSIHTLGVYLNYHRYTGDVIEELMYFPTGSLLQVVSLGFDSLIADVLWLRGIQYYGEHHRTDMDYPLAEHIFTAITDLDERFVGAYRFGAFVLADDVGQPAPAIDLLKKGMRSNPGRWELPFDLGFLYFVYLDESSKAARFFGFASRLPESPEIARRFSAHALRKAGRHDMARDLWVEIHQSSGNPVMRENARYAINRIDTDRLAEMLNDLVSTFKQEQGGPPENLEDLVRRDYLRRVPDEPFGGAFFLDPASGRVLSSTMVTETAERVKRQMERVIGRYKSEHQALPGSLQEITEDETLKPLYPLTGAEFDYDRDTGEVDYRLTLEGMQRS